MNIVAKKRFQCAIVIVVLFMQAFSAWAAPSDLDPSFGNAGIVITSQGTFGGLGIASAMTIQPDGKVILVGEGWTGPVSWDFAVVRYNVDGSLDTSFGGSGVVITPVGNSHDQAEAVAVAPDGRIVVGGYASGAAPGASSFALVRYLPNGSLDTSFGGTGKIIGSLPGDLGMGFRNLAIQPDGKIVAVAYGYDSNSYIVRYNLDGSLDTSFNSTGIVVVPGRAYEVAIQPDGKVTAAGAAAGNVAVFRYNSDGSPDASFNGTGMAVTHVPGGGSVAKSLALQQNGKIVVAGTTGFNGASFTAFVRYNPDGSLDNSFGSGGIATHSVGSFNFALSGSIAVQADDKIIAAGSVGNNPQDGSTFALIRLNRNGALDPSFGDSGMVTTRITQHGYIETAFAVAVGADGRIVAAGITDYGAYDFYNFVAVRYLGGPTPRTQFDYDNDVRADLSVVRPSNNVWYLLRGTAGYTAMQFGEAGDRMVPADYDGDGKTDMAVWRPSNGRWYIYMSQTQTFEQFGWGQDGDIPVPTDRDNDGKADLVIYRPSNNTWYTRFANGTFNTFQFGVAGDKPMLGDFDGDGIGDIALFRPSNNNWYIIKSSLGFFVQTWGEAGDIPLTGDFDGDGAMDQAVFRPSTGQWFLSKTTEGFSSQNWGQAGDIPVAADYDGDGKTDIAVFRPSTGTWYIIQSSAGILYLPFGQDGDLPTQAAYIN